jgi:integrase
MRPVDIHGNAIPELERDLERAPQVLLDSLEVSTRRSYGSGLLIYTVYADARGLGETQRFPPSAAILAAFVAAISGSYLGDTISKYLSGLRAWHSIHSIPWYGNDQQLSRLCAGANKHAPPGSRNPLRAPAEESEVIALRAAFDMSNSFDAACWTIIVLAFYGLARLGELTTGTEDAFKKTPGAFTTAADVKRADHDGRPTVSLRLPRSKVTRSPRASDDLHVAPLVDDTGRTRETCPVAALDNHLRVNAPNGNSEHLFTYRKTGSRGGRVPVTRAAFLKRLKAAASLVGVKLPHGHAFRIGGTLHYVLKGVPFDAVRVIGRWSSDCWQRYLRKHAEILAPYLQEDPERFLAFTRIAMPTTLQ